MSADTKPWVKIVSKQVDTTATYPTTLGTSQTSDEGTAVGSLRAVFALLGESQTRTDKNWDAKKKYGYLLNICKQDEVAIGIKNLFKIFGKVKILLVFPAWS